MFHCFLCPKGKDFICLTGNLVYISEETVLSTTKNTKKEKIQHWHHQGKLANQLWHADITIVKTKDNIKHYVYLLMDNFSKFILSWRIEPYVSGKVRMETIREAYNTFARDSQTIYLITDGGPENNNLEMSNFVNSKEVYIKPVIAFKDISFSNSLIEAQNKLFKYRYLFR